MRRGPQRRSRQDSEGVLIIQFGPIKLGMAALLCGAVLAACGGGPSPAASPASTKASVATSTAPSASSAETSACQSFHRDAVDFKANLQQVGSDQTAIAAAYAGFVTPVEQDQSGTEGTPLNRQLDALANALQTFAGDESTGGNPSNVKVVNAENVVFATCRGADPGDNWGN